MLLLEAMGTPYREGGGRHCTERMAEVRELEMVLEGCYHLWLFLAQMRIQVSGTLALLEAG